MRKHHKVLMIVITSLVIISFSWYWNKTDFAEMGRGRVGQLYGRNISQIELQRNVRLLHLAAELGMRDFLQAVSGGARTETDAAWNLMVLRHEGERGGTRPSATEIAEVVKTFPAFHGESGFDANKYAEFADHALAPMGFSEAQIEELAADELALKRLRQLLSVGVQVPESEVATNYDRAYAKRQVSVVRFRSDDFSKDVKIAEPEIAKYFEAHKAQLKSEEQRKVKFVSFSLGEEQKKLKGKERIDVLQKLADRANDFSQAIQEKNADFDRVAAKFQVTPKETADFTQLTPPPELSVAPTLARSAFQLTKEEPNSEAIQAPDGFYLLHLTGVTEARPLSLEEARPKIVEALKTEKVQQSIASKAAESANQLRAALGAGKPLEEAAAQSGLKVEKLPAFSLVEDRPPAAAKDKPPAPETPDMPYIKEAVAELSPGEVSEFVRTPEGGLIVAYEKSEPLEADKAAQGKLFTGLRYLESKRQIVFSEWLRDRRRAAGVAAVAEG